MKSKGYKETDIDSQLFSLIADRVVNREKYASRILLSIFPISNLYPFFEIITKKLNREYNAILNSLDDEELLNSLEEDGYIYNQNTILKERKDITSKIEEMCKIEQSDENINDKYIKISENDSLEMIKRKKALLDRMIYLGNIEEMDQISLNQEYEDNEQNQGVKQLGLIRKK